MKTFLKSMILMAMFFTSEKIFGQAPELVFRNPVLKSGQANKEGAVYRFANVTSGVDAEVKLKKFSRNDIVMRTIDNAVLGWDKAFQPEFGLAGWVQPWQHWYVDFEMTFYKAGTNQKQKMSRIDLTALDVDGDGNSVYEYVTYENPNAVTYSTVTYLVNNGISLLGQLFTCGADNISSPLVACSNCGGDGLTNSGSGNNNDCGNCDGSGLLHDACDHAYQGINGSIVQGPLQNFVNIDTLATQVMASYQYQNKDRIRFRYGARSGGQWSNGSGIRLNSTWFRQFSLAPVGTLPVTFHSFTALVNKKTVNLEWTVDTDDDFSHYSVERSTDGKSFSEIGIVMTTGGLREISTYKYKDLNVSSPAGVVYYRLRWEESTKETVYSQVRVVRLSETTEAVVMTAYPNPAKDQLRLSFCNAWQGKKVQVELFAANGIRVQSQQFASSSQTETLQIQGLAKGLYIVRASCNGQTAEQRIIKD